MRYRGTKKNDILTGTDADDVFVPFKGHDVVDGGGGHDLLRVDYSSAASAEYASAMLIDADGHISGVLEGAPDTSVRFSDIEQVVFTATAGNDKISLRSDASHGASAVVLDGGAGRDELVLLYFRETDDTQFIVERDGSITASDGSFAGFETFLLQMGNGDDTLRTGRGDDELWGGLGNDILSGGAGDDLLVGHRDDDVLTGGRGADRFYFVSARHFGLVGDVITDFSRAEGDVIDLARIDADETVRGNQPFAFIGADAFTGTVGELRIAAVEGDTVRIEGDNDRDGVADFAFTVVTTLPLAAEDFLL